MTRPAPLTGCNVVALAILTALALVAWSGIVYLLHWVFS